MVTANGDNPFRRTLPVRDFGVPERGALLLVAIHRPQQQVDIDARLGLYPFQHLCPPSQSQQMPGQNGVQLPDVAVGEFP